MDLKRLRTFVAVAEHGTVSKAAEVLHIAQPALSRQISRLEQEIGFSLFGRVGRRLLLTPRGEQLLGDCRDLLSHAGALTDRAQALRRGDLRVLKIAASALTIETIFPGFLGRYMAHVPGVGLSLIEADAANHLEMLERGEVHLAINVLNILQVDDHRFASYLLPKFHVVAACAPSLEIERGDTIDIRQLSHHPLLVMNSTYATRGIFDAACRVAGIRPHIHFESGAVRALIGMAEAGHGIAILPSIVQAHPKRLRVLKITHRREALQIALAVLWDRRRTLPRYAKGFSELLATYLREAFPASAPSRKKRPARAR